jgi:hypothetical protein
MGVAAGKIGVTAHGRGSHNAPPLSEKRHDFLGKQPHRLLHKRGVHQPSLVEVSNELVKTNTRPATPELARCNIPDRQNANAVSSQELASEGDVPGSFAFRC